MNASALQLVRPLSADAGQLWLPFPGHRAEQPVTHAVDRAHPDQERFISRDDFASFRLHTVSTRVEDTTALLTVLQQLHTVTRDWHRAAMRDLEQEMARHVS